MASGSVAGNNVKLAIGSASCSDVLASYNGWANHNPEKDTVFTFVSCSSEPVVEGTTIVYCTTGDCFTFRVEGIDATLANGGFQSPAFVLQAVVVCLCVFALLYGLSIGRRA